MSREQQIRDAVAIARQKVPSLAADFADKAIASGKSVEQVKADLTDKILGHTSKDMSRANMLAQLNRSGVDLKTPSASIPSAQKTADTTGHALTKASMAKILRAQGLEPVSR